MFNINSSHLRTLIIPIQVAVSILILYLLVRNVNLAGIFHTLSQVNIPILLLSTAFFILSSLAIGFVLHGALKSADATPPMISTQLGNFGGVLLSNITPDKSGYFVTPILLNQLKAVPLETNQQNNLPLTTVAIIILVSTITIGIFYLVSKRISQ